MWVMENRTAYAAERNWVRDKRGRHFWLVAVRATFDIAPLGQVTLCDDQPPPALAPEYVGEPGLSSLRWDSDLLYIKPCTDVIAEAQAHAPLGRPCDSAAVSLRVGPLHKQLLVHGTRVFYKGVTGLTTTSPEPFVTRPILYEYAFGGTDTTSPDPRKHGFDARNPIGKGFALDTNRLVHAEAPSIEYPGRQHAAAGPAGFGPLDPAWQPRRGYAGTYDAQWEATKKPLLPDDYDDLYGSCAPADQRIGDHLRGGEGVELLGLTPEGALRFELPKIYLTYTTHLGNRREVHRGKLVTVLLLPEERKVSMVWQSALMVGARDGDYLDKTVIGEKAYLT